MKSTWPCWPWRLHIKARSHLAVITTSFAWQGMHTMIFSIHRHDDLQEDTQVYVCIFKMNVSGLRRYWLQLIAFLITIPLAYFLYCLNSFTCFTVSDSEYHLHLSKWWTCRNSGRQLASWGRVKEKEWYCRQWHLMASDCLII